MPATYKDQFYQMDPANPPPGGTPLAIFRLELVDQNDDNDIDRFNNDTVNGQDVTRSWPGDTITVNTSAGQITYTGTTFYLADGTRFFTPTDGQVLLPGTFVSATFVTGEGPLDVGDLGPTCFTPGVRVETEHGPCPVGDIAVGDLVWTLDHGLQPVRHVLHQEMSGQGLFAPVRVMKGALGNKRGLLFSQQHRVLLNGWRTEMMFGESEFLVAVKHLLNGDTIRLSPRTSVTYVHLAFDRHEVLMSDGLLTESYFCGAEAEPGPREVLAMRRPDLQKIRHMRTARPVLQGYEGRVLAA